MEAYTCSTVAEAGVPDRGEAEMVAALYCRKEQDGGEDFRARYLLTDKGGIRVDAGFEPVGDHQNTDVSLMDSICHK